MKKCWGVVTEGYQNVLRDFPYYFWKLQEKFLPTGLVVSLLPPTGSEYVLFMLISTSAPPFFVEGARLLRLFIVSVLSGRALSSTACTEGRLGRRFLVFSTKLSLGGGGLSGLVGGLFLGISLKGLIRRPLVGVFGPQSGESVQRGLVRKGTKRTCWRRWLLSGGLVSTFSFFEDSGDELHLLLFSILLPLLHSLGPKRSLPPTAITRRWSLSHWGRSTVEDSRTVLLWSRYKWVYSSVAVTPASCDISWASRMVELARWDHLGAKRLTSFATEEWRKMMTFCRKLYTASKDVDEMVAECADRAAKASNQEEHFAISASGTWSTAVEVGGFNMTGESSCSSHRFGKVEGILWAMGKSLGVNSLSQAFLTVGGGHWYDELPTLGCCPCW